MRNLNIKCLWNWMPAYAGMTFVFLFILVGQANSNENENKNGIIDNSVVIKGDQQALEISDLPLSQYQFDDISFFTKNFEPQKELLSLLDNPDILMQLDNKSLALDFTEQ